MEKRFAREREAENLSLILSEAMRDAYKEVFKNYREYVIANSPEEIYKDDDKCQQVSEAARNILNKKGVKTEYVYIRDKKIFLEYGGSQHVYLLVEDRYLLDGTWQSFIDGDMPHRPFLILDTQKLEEDLAGAGVPNELWPIWLSYADGLKRRQMAA